MLTKQNNCLYGKRKGQVVIATINGFEDLYSSTTRLYFGDAGYGYGYAKQDIRDINYAQFQTYGIEWSATFLQIFVNDRVYFQSNPYNDETGTVYKDAQKPFYLPFQHPFNLLLNIGIYYRKLYENDVIYQGNFESWESPELEIDYIRVYGEKLEFGQNSPTLTSEPTRSISISTIIIAVSIMFSSFLIIVMIIYFKRKSTQVNSKIKEIDYDDIGQAQSEYDEIRHEYESVSFVSEVYNEPDQTVEYLEIFE